MPRPYATATGYKLGAWVSNLRTIYANSNKNSRLTAEQVSRLESLDGWAWDKPEAAWEEGFSYLIKYIERERHAKVPQSFIIGNGYLLGSWVSTQRRNKDKLSPDRKTRLESLSGWVWNLVEERWQTGLLG